MSEDIKDPEVELAPDEEIVLIKQRLDLMGIKYHHKAGLEKLKGLLNDALKGEKEVDPENQEFSEEEIVQLEKQVSAPKEDTPEVKELLALGKIKRVSNKPVAKRQRDAERRKESMKLIRIRLTALDPSLKEHTGHLACVSNRITNVRKFIPFDVPWMVPKIIVDHLKERVYNTFKEISVKDGFNKKVLVKPQFGIEYMEDMTIQELKDIKNAQLARSEQ